MHIGYGITTPSYGEMVGYPHNAVYVQLRFSVSCFEDVKDQLSGYKVMDIQLFIRANFVYVLVS